MTMPMMQQTVQPRTSRIKTFCVLFLNTSDSSFSVVCRFERERSQDEPGHDQQAWAALCEKFDGCSQKALRAEHYKMNHTKMTPGQDSDKFLYIIVGSNGRNRINTSTPPEGPTDRQYENILLQVYLVTRLRKYFKSPFRKARL